MLKVSLIASSVRPQLYPAFFKSLEGTSVEYEVVFAGNNQMSGWICGDGRRWEDWRYVGTNFKYVETRNIKPSQCYEIARRHATGEVVIWVADDAESPNDVIGKAYTYWKQQNNEKLMLSIQTRESGYNLPVGQLFDMDNHRFFGYQKNTPLMAPLGLMSRKFLDDIGGFDQRYVCGQYENDVVMRGYAAGGSVAVFGDKHCFIDIDHLGKSIAIGESKVQADFLNRPFAKGYPHDRMILETSWCRYRKFKVKEGDGERLVSIVADTVPDLSKLLRYDEFAPYEDKDILTKSQGERGMWE